MGRPLKIVDEKEILELASKGRSGKEIAAYCDISEATLYRRFKSVIERGHELRNGSIRSKQFDVAMTGNALMLKWLGQQHLGQSEKVASMTGDNFGIGDSPKPDTTRDHASQLIQ